MKKTLSLVLAIPLLAGLVFLSGCEHDDSPSGTAKVTGNVRQFYSPNTIAVSSTEKAVADVTVELKRTDGSYSAMATSAADGTFRFENVPAGDYELLLTGGGLTGKLTFTVPDGATVELVDIVVKADGTTREGEIVKAEAVVAVEPPAPAPVAAPVPKVQWLDQEQTASDTAYVWQVTKGVAQVFTIGATNTAPISIFKVELDLYAVGTPTADVTVTIRAGSAVGAVLGTATLATGDIAGEGTLETVIFSPAISVNPGDVCAIVCSTTEAVDNYGWLHQSNGTYAGGSFWYESPYGSGTFIEKVAAPSGTYDAVFKVWLEK